MARTSRSRWQWTILSSCVALSSASRPFGRSSPARQWQKACASRWSRRVIEATRKAFESGSLEDGYAEVRGCHLSEPPSVSITSRKPNGQRW